jgi:carbon monoxide dehydrogenase subunit G
MFTGDEVVLDVGFAAARARLANLTRSDLLRSASDDAYGAGIAGLARVGALGLTKVVRVQTRELAETDRSAGIAVRWEATGPGGGLFPALDADIRLFPQGEQTTLLVLSGVYRPPLGSLGAALDRAALHRIATATIRNFLSCLASHITGQASPAETGAGLSALPIMPETS